VSETWERSLNRRERREKTESRSARLSSVKPCALCGESLHSDPKRKIRVQLIEDRVPLPLRAGAAVMYEARIGWVLRHRWTAGNGDNGEVEFREFSLAEECRIN
jgi:hypothetical protein